MDLGCGFTPVRKIELFEYLFNENVSSFKCESLSKTIDECWQQREEKKKIIAKF